MGAHGSCLVGWRPLRRPVCGRTVCASVPVKSYSVKLVRQRTLRPSVPTAVVSVRPLRQTDTSSCCRQNKTSPCRDARSVRPSPLKATVSSWFEQRTLRPSVPTAVVSVRPLRQTDTSSCCRQNKTSPCRDARSVRPSPLKATASSWFDNGRSDRASLQQSSRCVHYVKPIRHPVVDKTKHHPVGTHGLCVRPR